MAYDVGKTVLVSAETTNSNCTAEDINNNATCIDTVVPAVYKTVKVQYFYIQATTDTGVKSEKKVELEEIDFTKRICYTYMFEKDILRMTIINNGKSNDFAIDATDWGSNATYSVYDRLTRFKTEKLEKREAQFIVQSMRGRSNVIDYV